MAYGGIVTLRPAVHAYRESHPGSGKAIAGLLAEEASTGKIKKVKKALRSIGKSGAIGKASAAA